MSDDPWKVTVLTLYPDMFPGSLGQSLAGRALENEVWSLETVNIRDFATDKHKTVDDTPAGGGPGMVMRADVVAGAIDASGSENEQRPLIYLSPRGKPLTQERVKKLSQGPGVRLLCGRFEGIDERVIEVRAIEEVSIGDFILSGGEVAALTLLDAVIRLLPGVMGDPESASVESFESGLLEHPHYTRPRIWEGREIPEVLLSGNHGAVEEWRLKQARRVTEQRRPDLLGETDGTG